MNKTKYLFPGGPLVKNQPSDAEDTGSIPGQELRSHMPNSMFSSQKEENTCILQAAMVKPTDS